MKLAEALAKRKRLVTEILELQSAALSSIWIDADSEDERPDLDKIETLRIELRVLIWSINMANSRCGMTSYIAERDELQARVKWLTSVAASMSSDATGRYGTKVKRVRTVDPSDVRTSLSLAQDQLIKLESEINRLNWEIDL